MSKVSPPRSRASIDDLGDGVEVSIPTRKNWLLILFLGAWMCGWFFGETSAISQLMAGEVKNSGSRGFLTFWLVGWTVGGFAAGTAWLWNIAGVERARFRSDGVSVRREVLGIGFTREYDASHIRNLRVSGAPAAIDDWRSRLHATGLLGGAIAFDYGSSTVRFAMGLDEAEASQIVSQIRSRFLFARS
jgi:hypothetical protein